MPQVLKEHLLSTSHQARRKDACYTAPVVNAPSTRKDVKATRGRVGAWKRGPLPSWTWKGVLEMMVLSCMGKDVSCMGKDVWYFFSQIKQEGHSRQ